MTNNNYDKIVALCAGGTGGHLFPALALAKILQERGYRTVLISDSRASSLVDTSDNIELFVVNSATPYQSGIKAKIFSVFALIKGVFQARKLLKKLKPKSVIGFGGYPTVPPLLAAKSLSVPILIHDQNAVMGRANRLLSNFAASIATSYDAVKAIHQKHFYKCVKTGNPLRENVIKAADIKFPTLEDNNPINILIFGGSQGARVLSDVTPQVICDLPSYLKKHVKIIQQARPEDLDRVKDYYARNEIEAEIDIFFKDLPEKIAQSHLIISRSGAMTVAEICAIGRPSILVPLPSSLDGDQSENAIALKKTGGAWIIRQNDFTKEKVSGLLIRLLTDRELLVNASSKAKSFAILNATEKLADLVEEHSQ